MKKVICAALFSVFVSHIYAQSDSLTESFEEDYYTTIKDLRENEKFRVGVDISTPIVGSLVGVNLRPRASLIFNLKAAPNRAWRFIPMYERNRRFTDFRSSSYNAFAINDTAVVYRNQHQEEYRVAARLGAEWFKQYEKNTVVYGVDLVFGYNSEYSSFVNSYQPFDENGNLESFTVGAGFFNTDEFYTEEVFRLLLGVDFSIGYKFFLGEKADISFEWIPEYTYRPHYKTTSNGNSLIGSPVNAVNRGYLDLRGVSVQFHYKFLDKSKR